MSATVFAVTTSFVLFIVLIAPFFVYGNQRYSSTLNYDNLDLLLAIQASLLRRFLEDEKLAKQKELSSRAWASRKSFLMARYIDVTRRIDFIESQPSSMSAKDGA